MQDTTLAGLTQPTLIANRAERGPVFAELYRGRQGATVAQGRAWLDQLAASKHYLVEVWSAG